MVNQLAFLDVSPTPRGAPRYLDALLGRLHSALQSDAPVSTRRALRDALGFLVRYFASVAAAPGGSSRECEAGIAYSLQMLGHDSRPFAVSYRSVFFREGRGSRRFLPFAHTRMLLGLNGPLDGVERLSEWLHRTEAQQPSELDCLQEVYALLPVLNSWLDSAEPFFSGCEHEYSGPATLVTRFQGRTLPLGFSLRSRDFSEAAEPPTVSERRRRIDSAPLVQFVEELLRVSPSGGTEGGARRLSPPSGPATRLGSRAARPPRQDSAGVPGGPPRLEVTALCQGLEPDPIGAGAYRGKLVLTHRGGGVPRGRLAALHPGVRLSRSRFRGDLTLDYRFDPGYGVSPDRRCVLVLTDTGEERELTAGELLPRPYFSEVRSRTTALFLLVPSLLVLAYLSLAYQGCLAVVGSGLERAGPGIGAVELMVAPRIQHTRFLFLALGALAPMLTLGVYRKLPPGRRRLLGPFFLVGLVLPTAGFLAGWAAGMFEHPALGREVLARLRPWNLAPFAVFNLGAAAYAFLSVEGYLDRWMGQVPRVLLPLAAGLAVAFAAVMLA